MLNREEKREMMTDPIADLLTRIRNAIAAGHKDVSIPSSKLKEGIADVLKREGFIKGYEVLEDGKQNMLKITLKYGPDGERLISVIKRESSPGRRWYSRVTEVKPVLAGTGIGIYTTSKGVLSDRECRREKVGGEYLCTVY